MPHGAVLRTVRRLSRRRVVSDLPISNGVTMFRVRLMTTAVFAGVAAQPMNAQERVPGALDNLKPHEVVEAIHSESEALGLTSAQGGRLDSLHLAVRDERHRWETISGNKAHQAMKMRPMISADSAYSKSLAILTPEQRNGLARLLADTSFVPVVPSLANELPASLTDLEAHELPQAFLGERQSLSLTNEQVQGLATLHVAIRDEAHRYARRRHGPKGHPHMMMEPMVSRRRAYNDALSYLNQEQQVTAGRIFKGGDYEPRLTGSIDQ